MDTLSITLTLELILVLTSWRSIKSRLTFLVWSTRGSCTIHYRLGKAELDWFYGRLAVPRRSLKPYSANAHSRIAEWFDHHSQHWVVCPHLLLFATFDTWWTLDRRRAVGCRCSALCSGHWLIFAVTSHLRRLRLLAQLALHWQVLFAQTYTTFRLLIQHLLSSRASEWLRLGKKQKRKTGKGNQVGDNIISCGHCTCCSRPRRRLSRHLTSSFYSMPECPQKRSQAVLLSFFLLMFP